MRKRPGKDCLIRVDAGNGKKTVAGMRVNFGLANGTRKLYFESEKGYLPWLQQNKALDSLRLEGRGVFADPGSYRVVRDANFEEQSLDTDLVFPDFGVITGRFTYGGMTVIDKAGEITFSATVTSKGKVLFDPTQGSQS